MVTEQLMLVLMFAFLEDLLPDIGETDTRMESVEYRQRRGERLHDRPGLRVVVERLEGIQTDFLRRERVVQPYRCKVEDDEKG